MMVTWIRTGRLSINTLSLSLSAAFALGFSVWVWGSDFRVSGFGLKVWGVSLVLKVQGLQVIFPGLRGWGSILGGSKFPNSFRCTSRGVRLGVRRGALELRTLHLSFFFACQGLGPGLDRRLEPGFEVRVLPRPAQTSQSVREKRSRVDCTKALMAVLGALMAVFRVFEAVPNASKAAFDSRAGCI